MKPAALFCRLERLLKLHARGGDKAGARFLHRKLCELTAENLRGLEFRRAVFAARDVLLQFMTGIISQFVINIENNVLLYPFTLHSFLSTTVPPSEARQPSSHLRQCAPQFLRRAEQRVLGGFFGRV